MALIEVRLRPSTPWRVGNAGDRERTGAMYRSDALYSAVTQAMSSLGWLEAWLDATARAVGNVAVRLSSLFPRVGDTRLVPPPRTHWPPSGAAKLHAAGAKLAPLQVARGEPFDESQWTMDGSCECMIPAGASTPFQMQTRSFAAVDRVTGAAEPHRAACLEFAPGAGWWGLIDVNDEVWQSRVQSALRLLADSGFGGGRSRGWGRAAEPEFNSAESLFQAGETASTGWWLLSLYSPHESDAVDWSRGDYTTETRGGWIDSAGGQARKKQLRLISEGSVLSAPSLRGRAVDVAPEGFPHPVYRAGFALAIPASLEAEA